MSNSCNNDSDVYLNTTDGTSKLANELPSVRLECASAGNNGECSVSMKPDCEFNVSRIDIYPEKVILYDSFHPKEAEASAKNQIYTQGNEMEHSKEVCGGSKNSNETSQVPNVIACASLAEEVVHCVKIELDDKSCTRLKQSTRSPCLVSEMSGSNYRKLLSNPAGSSPVSDSKECLISNQLGSSKFPSLIPGFGLGLNALADTGRDTKSMNPPLDSEVVGRTQPNENACKSSTSGEGSGFPQSSLNMKRKRSDNVGETDSCKRCNCKRSKCLKLYCECFTARVYCVGRCNCQDCFNKPAHEDIVLAARRQIESRNALAFSSKVIMCSNSPNCGDELNKIPASARYIKGCNCKRSGCLKKYCECFQRGVGCSMSCKCGSCKNSFGQKEGNEGIVLKEVKIFTECASDVTLHDKLSKTDNESQAAYEHSDNSRDASACESSFKSEYTDQHDVMHIARDKETQDMQSKPELENTRLEAEVEVEMKKEHQPPTMMEQKEMMEMNHLNTLLGRENLSPAEERLKLRLIQKFYPNT